MGLGLAFYRERNDKLFRSPGDLPKVLNVQELGVIPRANRLRGAGGSSSLATTAAGNAIALTGWGDHFSLAAEAYRNITFSILLANSNKRLQELCHYKPECGGG